MNCVRKVLSIFVLFIGIFEFVWCEESPDEELVCYVETGAVALSDYNEITRKYSTPETVSVGQILQIKNDLQEKSTDIKKIFDFSEQDFRDFANGRLSSDEADETIRGLKQNVSYIIPFSNINDESIVMWVYFSKSH